MDPTQRIARNLQAFREGVAQHDQAYPDHQAWGIGLCAFDLERLGLEEGEELWSGIQVVCDGGTSGNFRVLCDQAHQEQQEQQEQTWAVAV